MSDAATAIDARRGIQLDQVRDGLVMRCPTCRAARVVWRGSRAEHVRAAFRSFVQLHRRCYGGRAVQEGTAPVRTAFAGGGVE